MMTLATFPQNEDGHEAARRLADWLQEYHGRYRTGVTHTCDAIHVVLYPSRGLGLKWVTIAHAVGAFAEATYQGE